MNLDPSNLKKVIQEFPNQVNYILEKYDDFKLKYSSIKKIMITGMGGSAFPGDIVNNYLSGKAIIDVNRNYTIPDYVSSDTLIIASSYSGNTEESISALNDALEKGHKTCVITAGGELEKIAIKKNLPLILIPNGLPPRTASGYFFASIIVIMAEANILSVVPESFKKIENFLTDTEVEDLSKEIAKKLVGKVPIIYSSDDMSSLAKIWKIKFNEHSKQQAFYNVFPELNHNELIGWTSLVTKPQIILLKDDNDHPRIIKRMEITKSILEEKDIPVLEVTLQGKSKLEKIFYALYLGDYTAYNLALLNNIDPWPVDLVEEFKAKLQE